MQQHTNSRKSPRTSSTKLSRRSSSKTSPGTDASARRIFFKCYLDSPEEAKASKCTARLGQPACTTRSTTPTTRYSISHTQSSRFGNVFGILYSKEKQVDLYPKRIRGANKRGVWQYEFTSTKDIVLDNGLIYTSEEIKEVAESYRREQKKEEEAAEQAAEQT